MRSYPSIKNRHILLISFLIQISLLIYADHVDSHPERYGGLKYTDVDWRVVSDGASLIFRFDPENGNVAKGWLSQSFGLRIGDPYNRQTFRYTPLLPLLLSPVLLHPLAGKLVLVVISLVVGPLLLWHPDANVHKSQEYKSHTSHTGSRPSNKVQESGDSKTDEQDSFWPVHLLWTLNPFVLNITTRGSPEAIIVFLTVSLLISQRALLLAYRFQNQISAREWETRAAISLSLAISYKIYPVIYVPTIWKILSSQYGWFGRQVWRFGIITAGCLVILNGAFWSIELTFSWGQPFLEHTFLYHLHRLDHRHNFSPYFYPIYLSFFPASAGSSLSRFDSLQELLRHPLVAFIPQNTLALLTGFLIPSSPATNHINYLNQVSGLELTMFLQTAMFVVFNKVCTSQYFTWFLPLLAPLVPQLRKSFTRMHSSIMVGSWIAAQGLWLGMAYRLEFLGQSVHLAVWAAGLVLFAVSVWVVGEIFDGFGSSLLSNSTKVKLK